MQTSTAALLTLVTDAALTVLTSALTWRRPGSAVRAVLLLLLLAVAATAATLIGHVTTPALPWDVTLALACGLAAVLGGGPLTSAVFTLVDHSPQASGSAAAPRPSVRGAGEILRGGAWIGALERAAVYAALASGWPEGVALTVALKSIGRYPELRNEDHSGIAERFLIGTFTSVLWACAWAGITLTALR